MPADFRHTRFLKSAAALADLPPDTGCEVAFAGRSNAGKSSALNAITGVNGLARVSKTPGRTQLINLFTLDETRRLVDLPGYGYAKVPDAVRAQWGRLMEAYFSCRQALVGLVLVMDIRHPLTEFDRHMLAWSSPLNLPVLALLTKSDKLTRNHANQAAREVSRQLAAFPMATVGIFSAVSRQGVDAARQILATWLHMT
ncbi:MAG TPA: ribosome biogenesis GTP-binding protein YihA/YsxC [Gammaproteobacteria bacterium]|nr:ribosome biogenesis GTP-binding protein YihA/YsxC [Gammaproteobacteria bacterium]